VHLSIRRIVMKCAVQAMMKSVYAATLRRAATDAASGVVDSVLALCESEMSRRRAAAAAALAEQEDEIIRRAQGRRASLFQVSAPAPNEAAPLPADVRLGLWVLGEIINPMIDAAVTESQLVAMSLAGFDRAEPRTARRGTRTATSAAPSAPLMGTAFQPNSLIDTMAAVDAASAGAPQPAPRVLARTDSSGAIAGGGGPARSPLADSAALTAASSSSSSSLLSISSSLPLPASGGSQQQQQLSLSLSLATNSAAPAARRVSARFTGPAPRKSPLPPPPLGRSGSSRGLPPAPRMIRPATHQRDPNTVDPRVLRQRRALLSPAVRAMLSPDNRGGSNNNTKRGSGSDGGSDGDGDGDDGMDENGDLRPSESSRPRRRGALLPGVDDDDAQMIDDGFGPVNDEDGARYDPQRSGPAVADAASEALAMALGLAGLSSTELDGSDDGESSQPMDVLENNASIASGGGGMDATVRQRRPASAEAVGATASGSGRTARERRLAIQRSHDPRVVAEGSNLSRFLKHKLDLDRTVGVHPHDVE
jgi:hypothetical protein